MSEEVTTVVTHDHVLPARNLSSHRQGVRTILLCRNVLVSVGLQHLLEGTHFTVAGRASDPASIPHPTPDLFIVDGSIPVEQTVEAVRHLKGAYPDARIAVIADNFDLTFVRRGRGAGVDGFCLTGQNQEVLIKCLELVMLGEAVLPAALMASLLNGAAAIAAPKPQENHVEAKARPDDPRARKLSAREAEILGYLMEGAANKVIARRLDVAEATIKVHIKAILRKIGAANRTQAAMWASTHLPNKDGSSLAA
jgi:two-component system nitrate/nitrite response regulator NarL